MKSLFFIALFLAPTFALAAEHACDKAARQAVGSIFGPNSSQIVSSEVIASHNGGAMGENEDIKIIFKGDVNGYIVFATAGPGDSQDCNVSKVYLAE